ncbi:MAG TPA: PfkB family carbohydrate kinase [Candidatus Paceibacterota bacterium]|nr:PfkB family carbohydrate kinase [Candidatus Paceibacterota bacterium]
MESEQQIDILAIGDIVTDAFIKLKDASVHCKIDDSACELCMSFGDKVPYESVEEVRAVGNSANAAVCAARLGLHSALIAAVGNDTNGKNCLEALAKNGVETGYINISKEYPTNYHYVLWYDVDRTILVNHAPFKYTLPELKLQPKWIYLSSLGESAKDFHTEILDYLHMHPSIKLAFQPGTFQMKLGIEGLRGIYERSDFLCLNKEEAERILKMPPTDPKVLLQDLAALGPKIVVVTDGFDGAYAYNHGEMYFMPVYPHKPFERTGAGDSFASTIVSALAVGKTFEEAFVWAPINAMSVVQYVGAQRGLLNQTQLLAFLTKAPPEYAFKKI